MPKLGTIVSFAPSLSLAVVLDTEGKSWFLPAGCKGRFFPEGNVVKIQLIKTQDASLEPSDKVIYFLPQETEPVIRLWAFYSEYETVVERIKKSLEEKPIIRVMEHVFINGKPQGEPRVALQPMPEDEFIRKYPMLTYDPYLTRGDYSKEYRRWFQLLTMDDWITYKDPRVKPK